MANFEKNLGEQCAKDRSGKSWGLIGDTMAMWVADFYDGPYYSKPRTCTPMRPMANKTVSCGAVRGSIMQVPRAVHHNESYPLDTRSFIGFRCAMNTSP